MNSIEFIIYKRLGKTDLDVLLDRPENEGHTYVALVKRVGELIREFCAPTAFTPEGNVGSLVATIQVDAVAGREEEYPSRELEIRVMGGKRQGEIKLDRQRGNPLETWKKPLASALPKDDEAFIFLVRDHQGAIHARYVQSFLELPAALRTRILATDRSTGVLDLRREGKVVLDYPLFARILDALSVDKNVILYGPPGTGKTWLMRQVAEAFQQGIAPVLFDPRDLGEPFKQSEGQQPIAPDKEKRKTEFVVFHQSMSYEAFVVGIRPVIEDGEIGYQVTPGPLIELADHAVEGASLLLIDEINRGNTSEIFGELISLIEADKRDQLQARLPYAPEKSASVTDGRLTIPGDLYVLASMNSVDRGVAPLDSALRRRFRVMNVPPDFELLIGRFDVVAQGLDSDTEQERWARLFLIAHNLLKRVNEYIGATRGPDFLLGHAYLWPIFDTEGGVAELEKRLVELVADRILPQLWELFRDDSETLFELLGGYSNEGLLFHRHDPPGDGASGAFGDQTAWLEQSGFPLDDIGASLNALRVVARVGEDDKWTSVNDAETIAEEDEDEAEL